MMHRIDSKNCHTLIMIIMMGMTPCSHFNFLSIINLRQIAEISIFERLNLLSFRKSFEVFTTSIV